LSDSILDLGVSPVFFDFFHNWTKPLDADFLSNEIFHQTESSYKKIITFDARKPKVFKIEIVLNGLDQIKSFLDFFDEREGIIKPFWFKSKINSFTVSTAITSGATEIEHIKNGFPNGFSGHERFYIENSSGDIITRKIQTAVSVDLSTDKVTFTDEVGQDIEINEVSFMGFCVLCRFMNKNIKVKYQAPTIATVDVTLKELIEEYP